MPNIHQVRVSYLGTKNWKDTFDKPMETTWSSSGEWAVIKA